MTLKIIPSTEPITIHTAIIVLYGQPGMGKTSVACSANTLLLDFDGGVQRSEYRGDSVPVTAWKDVEGMVAEDLKGYDVLAVDTVGRCLDALSVSLVNDNPKLATRAGGLTLQGYGALKSSFAAWTTKIRAFGKDLVLVAHDKEDKKGDDLIVRPDVVGGSLSEILKLSDTVAYLHAGVGGKRMLDFSPSDEWVGKNPVGLETIEVPHLSTSPNFMGDLLQQIKDAVGAISERSAKTLAVVEEHREKIEAITEVVGMNKMLADVQKIEDTPVQIQAKHILMAQMKALGMTFDKKIKKFVAPPIDEPSA